MPAPTITAGAALIDPAMNKKSRFAIKGTNLDMDENGVTVTHASVNFTVTKAKPKRNNTVLAITVRSDGYLTSDKGGGVQPIDLTEITVTVTNSNNEEAESDLEVIFDEE